MHVPRNVTAACLLIATLASVPDPASAIDRGRAHSSREGTPRPPILLAPSDRVRIETRNEPSRVPTELRGKFVGWMAGLDTNSITVTLEDGQPAVLHRDLVKELELSVDHGSTWKHMLIGAAIGASCGALAGGLGTSDADILSPEETAAIGAVVFGAIGLIVGYALPSGEGWRHVSMDRAQWAPSADMSNTTATSRASSPSP